jgi:predicted dienelactone hydrolase
VWNLVDPTRTAWRGSGGRPIRVHVLRPERRDPAPPVVLLSHGTGGAAKDLVWLAEALAVAGFMVAAIDHHGHNYIDGYEPQAFACWWDRPMDLSFVCDHLAGTGRLGPVGAAGFSIGGYTVAALLGARIDALAFQALASGQIAAPPTPEYPGLASELRARVTDVDLAEWASAAGRDYRDDRVLAGLLMSPSLGPMVTAESLTDIRRPVEVWWGGSDEITPAPANALRYAELIPGARRHNAGSEVGHYAFLDGDSAGVSVRSRVAAAAVAFFKTSLTSGK